MKRIVFTFFLILININLGRSQGDLDYDQAMNFFFSDLEILMNGNVNEIEQQLEKIQSERNNIEQNLFENT